MKITTFPILIILSSLFLMINGQIMTNFSSCLVNGHFANAWYDGESFDSINNLWNDKTSNNQTATIVGTALNYFDGTDKTNSLWINNQSAVYGTGGGYAVAATKITFGNSAGNTNLYIKGDHTIFNLCKYNIDGGYKRRIIQGLTGNSAFGFWNGRSGVALEPNGFITDNINKYDDIWVLSAQSNDLYRANGIDLTINNVSKSADIGLLQINDGATSGETSHFACAEVIVFNNQKLEKSEIECIETYLNNKYFIFEPIEQPSSMPSASPTKSPTYKVCNLQELDWNELNTGDLTQLSAPIISSSWDAQTLQFSIDITLDYITRSKYTFIDQYDNDRGITYVIDTEPFLSDGRYLSNPNNCENRESTSFTGKDWTNEYWSYLNQANGLNSINYLEYGPSNIWTLNWDTECETITYSNTFLFNELLGCTNKDGANTFTFIEDTEWLNLTGSFYITLVSPLINQNNVAQSSTDIGQYLTNTIGNYPISISFPKTIASIRDPGVILFDISIFAIQYDEENSKLLVDILSYSAEYINLINVNVITPTIGYDSNGVVNSITINEDDSYSATECLFETNFRCFQKFQIEIDLISCPETSIDLSTLILLNTEPSCRNGKDCTLFRSQFGDIGTKTQLTESLSYIESCDTEIYIQTFEGTIKYFTDNEFTNEVDETSEFSIGSTLYVDVSVNDIAAYGVFNIDILNVWICTTSAIDLSIISQLTGEGGCIQNYALNNAQSSNIDEIYQVFKDGVPYDSRLNGLSTYDSLNDESIRFSLTIPSFQRNKFWLHAVVEMTLENTETRRMRLLLDDSETVNRLSHYIKGVSIVNKDAVKTTASATINSRHNTKKNSKSTVYIISLVIGILICICIISVGCFIGKRIMHSKGSMDSNKIEFTNTLGVPDTIISSTTANYTYSHIHSNEQMEVVNIHDGSDEQ